MRASIILAFISVVLVLCFFVYNESQQKMESDEQFLNENTLIVPHAVTRWNHV